MKREWNLPTIYLYLVCFVTLMMVVVGTVQLIQSAVIFVYPQPIYSPTPSDIQMRLKNQALPPGVAEEQAKKATEEQASFERERQEQQIRYDHARRVVEPFALIVVALPIYLYHWRRIQREAS